jgi:hypothetical protein
MIPVTFMHPPARHSSRLGQRFQVALGAAAALAAISLSPGSAQAFVVTVGGVQYDVTTFTGSYSNSGSKFQTPSNNGVMPWWGSATLADEFFRAVGTNLGLGVNAGANTIYGYNAAPAFAYGNYGDGSVQTKILFTDYVNYTYGTVGYGDISSTQVFVYAQATAVPTPAPLPLFGAAAAFGYSRQLRKRIKSTPGALASSLPLA